MSSIKVSVGARAKYTNKKHNQSSTTNHHEQSYTSCNKRSRHGGTFPTQGDAILRNVKPVIPSVLVSLPRYIIKCSGGKDSLVVSGRFVSC